MAKNKTTETQTIDFTTPICNFNGQQVTDGPTGPKIDLKYLVVGSLLGGDTKAMATPEKLFRYRLAKDINGGRTELTAHEVSQIKKFAGAAYSPLLAGQVLELLDGEEGIPETASTSITTDTHANEALHA